MHKDDSNAEQGISLKLAANSKTVACGVCVCVCVCGCHVPVVVVQGCLLTGAHSQVQPWQIVPIALVLNRDRGSCNLTHIAKSE